MPPVVMPSLIECGHGILTWAMILFLILVRSCCAHAAEPWDIAGHHHKAGYLVCEFAQVFPIPHLQMRTLFAGSGQLSVKSVEEQMK